MYTRYFVLVMGIVLVACSGATESVPTALPEPTTPPDPTATPTELVATELPPSPSPTDTPQATPTQKPTDALPAIQVDFTWYENNPILEMGATGQWDNWVVWDSKVVLVDDVFHMFYTGTGKDTIGIGYAVSTDGLTFTKHDANPIFQPDGKGFDAIGVGNATPLLVGDTWMLFYNGSAIGERLSKESGGAGSSIGVSTASDPTGPWATGQQVLKVGGPSEWDSGFILPATIIAAEDGYRLYYSAGQEPSGPESMCGMATSPDGINWTKHDDPDTTGAPYANSDPVMYPSSTGWDRAGVHCNVLKTDSGWEMLYSGGVVWNRPLIGYATSPDGVNWSKYQNNPILEEKRSFPTAIKVNSTYYLYGYNYKLKRLDAAIGTIE